MARNRKAKCYRPDEDWGIRQQSEEREERELEEIAEVLKEAQYRVLGIDDNLSEEMKYAEFRKKIRSGIWRDCPPSEDIMKMAKTVRMERIADKVRLKYPGISDSDLEIEIRKRRSKWLMDC